MEIGDPTKVVMVGDRLATDVLFGNVNQMATVYVKPFKTKIDKISWFHEKIFDIEKCLVRRCFERKL